MELKTLLFIYNPVAGTGMVKKNFFEIVDYYNLNGYLVTLCPVNVLEDFMSLKQTRYDYIVCSGGDGTINMVFSCLMKNEIKVPIAYIPSGSTNDYAYSLGITKDFYGALEQSIKGQVRKIDIGKFNEKYFLYVAGFGMFTKISYTTSQKYKNLLGHTAYILEGIKQLSDIKSYYMQIYTDDSCYEGNFILGLITNTISIGGIKTIMPADVELDDGLFEIILIKYPQNALELQEIVVSLLSEKKVENKNIVWCKTKKVTISMEEEVDWTLDGEYGGKQKEVNIINMQKEVEVVV